jgi:hypothetical protein
MVIKSSLILALILSICSFGFGQEDTAMVEQQMMPALDVDQMVFCTGVQDREPVGADTAFADTVGEVYCFTQISGADEPTTVSHVWYLNGEEKASVELSVGGQKWRTWSSKRIPAEWDGAWKVEVKSADGSVLMSKEFVVR